MRFIFGGVILAAVLILSALPDSSGEPVRKATGIDKRVLWTTSRVQGSPEPPPPYRLEKVFADLTFEEPLELAPCRAGIAG